MAGLAQLALGAAPIAGGALLAAAAGQLRGPDFRGALKQDMELLERIPPDQTQRRAELQRTINDRIDDLVAAADKSRALRLAANSYAGNWRDIVLFVCAVLFTIIWWNADHSRSNWLLLFIVMIIVSVLTAVYAARGTARGLARVLRRRGS
jgi:hypothetical protein